MRHRQTSKAGSISARPGVVVLALTAVGGVLAVTTDQSAGGWAAYVTTTAAALLGGGTLWRQGGLYEQRARQAVRARRIDQDSTTAATERGSREVDRLRLELVQEQQYTEMVQEQLNRLRRQLEEEHAARLAAEHAADQHTPWFAVAGLAGPDAAEAGTEAGDILGGTAEWPAPEADQPVLEFGTGQDEDAPYAPPAAEPLGEPAPPADPMPATSVTRFVPPDVSAAALAMAPVIGPRPDADALDLTAYDENTEFRAPNSRSSSLAGAAVEPGRR